MAGLIVQEWIEETGGAEQVLDAMRLAFPESRVACLWNDDPTRFPPGAVVESWLARTPLRGRKALALPLMSSTWRRGWGDVEHDWVLTSSYVFAHHAGFGTRSGVPKFSYVHTPARYLWEPGLDGRTTSPLAGSVPATSPRTVFVPRSIAARSRVTSVARRRARSAWQWCRVGYPARPASPRGRRCHGSPAYPRPRARATR